MQPSSDPSAGPPPDAGGFETTHWSLVRQAAGRHDQAAARALEQLCTKYWPPLYLYVYRRVSDLHAAQDLTQAFFERLLEKDYLVQARPDRGRFRAFLLTALKHFLANERERSRAVKRGGPAGVWSLDFAAVDPQSAVGRGAELTPDQWFDRQWAVTLLGQVMQQLEAEQVRAGKERQFGRLKACLTQENPEESGPLAEELGMTPAAVRMAASRLRQRYRELLRQEIARTVETPEEVDDEIRQLFQTFAR